MKLGKIELTEPNYIEAEKWGSIIVFPICRPDGGHGSRITLCNHNQTETSHAHVFEVESDGTVHRHYENIAANGSASFTPAYEGYCFVIACNGSGYPIDFDYLTGDCFVDLDFLNGNEGIYEGYAINAMSNVDHLPYPTVGIVFGKSGVSGGYESYSQIRLDVSSANTKIAIGFIGGDLSGTASLIPTSLVCKFSNAQGQTITSRPVSAFVGTVFIGSPAEIFQAMAPSAHSLSSFNTLMAGTNVVMEVSQEPATGLLFGIDVCNNFVVRQYGTGVVGFNGFTIKIPVISP